MKKNSFLFCVGANHKSADLSVREQLFLDQGAIHRIMPHFMAKTSLKEAIILSTCNRLELLAVGGTELNHKEMIQVFIDLQSMARHPEKSLSYEDINANVYHRVQLQAVEHIFSVASGLDSLVIGETQITGQFKDAKQHAENLGTLGPILDRLCQDALATAGKVRTNTDIGKKPVSISHAAIDLAARVHGPIIDLSMLLIGAGEMARVAAKNAVKNKVKDLILINRTPERAKQLAEEVGFGQVFGLEHLSSALIATDIVISSTAKQGYVIEAEVIKKIQAQRQFKPLFLIDIALPRDIDPACADIDNTYLFDIDDLKQVVADHIEERRLAAEKAAGMVTDSALHFMRWFDQLDLKPALSGFRRYLDELIERETHKTLRRGIFQTLNEDQRGAIEKLLVSVVGKISADAGRGVTTPPDGFYKEQLAAALTVLFPSQSSDKDEKNE